MKGRSCFESASQLEPGCHMSCFWSYLQAALRGQSAPLGAEQVEIETHMNAMRFRERQNVARAVDHYWLSELFRRQQLEDPARKYPATMLTWVRQVCHPFPVSLRDGWTHHGCMHACLLLPGSSRQRHVIERRHHTSRRHPVIWLSDIRHDSAFLRMASNRGVAGEIHNLTGWVLL